MSEIPFKSDEIAVLYQKFNAPIMALDCGRKCAPHNSGGKPFCCDICVVVPTAYNSEWDYLKRNTSLWKPWTGETCTPSKKQAREEYDELRAETPDSMVLLECLGPADCQREYRALTCRQFPFFPYVDSRAEFLGLSYYWEYEEKCWVISHLDKVSKTYIDQFVGVFDKIFERMPEELENYQYHSEHMRDVFSKSRRALPLLHRNGHAYKISTGSERMRRVPVKNMPLFGAYKIAALLPFPDELDE